MHASLLTISYFEKRLHYYYLAMHRNIHPLLVHKYRGVALPVGVLQHYVVSCCYYY
jgi:hypothetical protein